MLTKMSILTNKIIEYLDLSPFFVENDWVYYAGSNGICKRRTNGKNRKRLCKDDADSIVIAKNWLYYLVSNEKRHHIYKMKTDGSRRRKIIENIHLETIEYYSNPINVIGDWIFYRSKEGNLYRLKTDGTKKKLVCCNRRADLL